MEIVKLNKNNFKKALNQAKSVLLNSGLVIYPTETCYGIAALATSQEAVDKLLQYKRRPEGKPISVAVNSQKMAEKYAELNTEAEKVYKNFLPGPVTVISKDKKLLANGLASELGTLGIRIPDYKLALDLVNAVNAPITATSANSADKKTPYKVSDILDNLSQKQKDLIDLILDAGELPHNPPSTVIDTTRSELQVLRQGRVGFGKNKKVLQINSPKKMQEAGGYILKKYKNVLWEKCLLILFNAELGAGKTQFTKGLAKGLGINEIVSSPTYSLIQDYDFDFNEVKGQLIHLDAWRLESLDELKELEIETYFKQGNIIVVEWAGGVSAYFKELIAKYPVQLCEITIDYKSEKERQLTIYD